VQVCKNGKMDEEISKYVIKHLSNQVNYKGNDKEMELARTLKDPGQPEKGVHEYKILCERC
jgi:hypothetical protein